MSCYYRYNYCELYLRDLTTFQMNLNILDDASIGGWFEQMDRLMDG